jgi:hypothetical protein
MRNRALNSSHHSPLHAPTEMIVKYIFARQLIPLTFQDAFALMPSSVVSDLFVRLTCPECVPDTRQDLLRSE